MSVIAVEGSSVCVVDGALQRHCVGARASARAEPALAVTPGALLAVLGGRDPDSGRTLADSDAYNLPCARLADGFKRDDQSPIGALMAGVPDTPLANAGHVEVGDEPKEVSSEDGAQGGPGSKDGSSGDGSTKDGCVDAITSEPGVGGDVAVARVPHESMPPAEAFPEKAATADEEGPAEASSAAAPNTSSDTSDMDDIEPTWYKTGGVVGTRHLLSQMHFARSAFAAAAVGRAAHWHIYAVGGRGTRAVLGSSELFDSRLGQWRTWRALAAARQGHALALWKDVLICVGGRDGTGRLVREAELTVASWSPARDARASRSELELSAELDVSEDDAWQALTSPLRTSWVRAPRMPSGCFDTVAVRAGAAVWVLGGSNGITTLRAAQVFFVRRARWALAPALLEGRRGAHAALHEGRLRVWGGTGADGRALDSVEELDLESTAALEFLLAHEQGDGAPPGAAWTWESRPARLHAEGPCAPLPPANSECALPSELAAIATALKAPREVRAPTAAPSPTGAQTRQPISIPRAHSVKDVIARFNK